jgi:hypothetical protein
MGQLGQGQGGVAPEQATGFRTVTEKPKVNTLPGAIDSVRFVNGEQFSGEVSDEFVEAVISAQREVSDAIAREQIPRQYHAGIKAYFDHTRTALPVDGVEGPEDQSRQETPDAE